MDLMLRRRMLMAMQSGSAEQVGIFTKGYEATLKPGSTTSFVIPHNLGIMPRLCIIEIDRSMATLTNYCISDFIDFAVRGIRGETTGTASYGYHYNNADTSNTNNLPSGLVSATETTLTLGPPYSSVRSPWDTAANYHVIVLG